MLIWGCVLMMHNILKKVICIVLSFCCLFVFAGCNLKEALPLNSIVETILIENCIEKSKITVLCKPNDNIANLHYYRPVNVTDEELEKYIDDLLLTHEKMIEITDRNVVQHGDAIFVSYVVYYNSEIVANAKSESLLVGSGNYDKEFETAVVGAVVGEPFVCELSSPIDTEKYKKGDMLKYIITIESINCFETYTSSDQYILDYYNVGTQDEFLTYCRGELQKSKYYQSALSTDNDFLTRVAGKCSFYINKEEAATYSTKIVNQHKDMAYLSGLELGEYIEKVLDMTEEQFYDYCYEEGVKEIKEYLLVGACTKGVQINSEEAFAEFCSMSGYDITQMSEYAILKYWTVFYFSRQSKLSKLELFTFRIDPAKKNTVSVYKTSNIDVINFSNNNGQSLTSETQKDIILATKGLKFKYTNYQTYNHLYDTVIIFEVEGENDKILMIDQANGYIKYDINGKLAYSQLTDEIQKLIT